MPTYCWVCDCGERQETCLRVAQITDPATHPHCPRCYVAMRRDFQAEQAGLAEWSRNKGIFPYLDENMGPEPIMVESQQERRRLLKERGLYDRDVTDDARYKHRDKKRRFY